MSRRISLTRVIAINWYGFRQIFDVDESVLISGAFGTGKSALLDLTQYVLLGEHWRANRAAAGNARGRDLGRLLPWRHESDPQRPASFHPAERGHSCCSGVHARIRRRPENS
jgi:uncharacterized protein YPO0396